ncbi:CHAT domain-containing protein [Streptomyces sp. NPDC091280]|uniref:CHAT domain-containing protein n=1 Tax=Streptomyces sp. NPDC091280 TaxID=3365984 RepID=UPI0038165871
MAEALRLWYRYRAEGDTALETEAVALAVSALAWADRLGQHLVGAVARLNLGVMLSARYERTGGLDDLDTAARHLEAAAEVLPPGHSDMPQVHATIASAAYHRFQRSGDVRHLSRAVDAARLSVAADADSDDPRAVGRSSNLGNLLRVRYELAGDEKDLDEAIDRGKWAALHSPDDQRPLALGALIGSLVQRIVRRQEAADISEAVAIARQALAVMPSGYADRAPVLGAVVAALRLDHQFAGHRRSLTEAVGLQRELTDLLPDGSPDRALHLASLSELLRLRFEQLGSRADLDAAVAVARSAEGAEGAEAFAAHRAATRALAEHALSGALLADGDTAGAAAAARESVAAAVRIGRLAVGDNTDFAARALVLEGNAWLAVHEATGQAGARERAVDCYELAAGRTADDDPARGVPLGNAGLLRLNTLPDDAGAQELHPVIEQLREALTLTGLHSPLGAQNAANLGAALSRRYFDTRQPEDLDEVGALWADVTGLDSAPPQQRVRIAALAGEMLMMCGQHADAARRYADAVELLPMAAWLGADRASLEAGLTESHTLACDAAASRLEANGDAEAALRLLEAGRGVMWSRMLHLRDASSEVQQWNPALAERLAEIAVSLEAPQDFSGQGPLLADPASRGNDRREALAQEYRDLVEQAVSAGHGGFLAPPDRQELLGAAEEGPVVVVNLSRWRCDALIVTATGVHQYGYLPTELTAESAEQRAEVYLTALDRLDEARMQLHRAERARRAERNLDTVRAETSARTELLAAMTEVDTVLDRTVRWLWDAVAEPVLDALDRLGLPARAGAPADAPRLWWCATGALALLPLHAAGHHDDTSAAGPPRTLLDRFTCSSTPTVGALARARRGERSAVRQAAEPRRMLVVALPDLPGQPPLPQVRRELAHLRSLFPVEEITVLEGAHATRDAVREGLRTHSWAHVSCHGTQHLNSPSSGGLQLFDGLLSVAETSTGRHHGTFVLLSACKTFTGGRRLAEEAISLGAALHFTGYRHVVGTQWSVGEQAAADFSEEVHTALCTSAGFDPAKSAVAVRTAALRLRADASLPRLCWTPFTHIGP